MFNPITGFGTSTGVWSVVAIKGDETISLVYIIETYAEPCSDETFY